MAKTTHTFMNKELKLEAPAKTFGKVAFGDRDDPPSLAKLQNQKPGSEKNLPPEDRLLLGIELWLTNIDERGIWAVRNQLPQLAKEYPAIFAPKTPVGTALFRGVERISDKELKRLAKTTELADWSPVNSDGKGRTKGPGASKSSKSYMVCKKAIPYKPFRSIQSWTDVFQSASTFAEMGMLVTRQDRDFYFSKQVLALLFGRNEHEVIHIGKTYTNPVFLMVSTPVFQDIIRPDLEAKSKIKVPASKIHSVLFPASPSKSGKKTPVKKK